MALDADEVNLLIMDGEFNQALQLVHAHLKTILIRFAKAEHPGYDLDQLEACYMEAIIDFRRACENKSYKPEAPDSHPLKFLTTIIRRRAHDKHRDSEKANKALDVLARGLKDIPSAFSKVMDDDTRKHVVLEVRKAIAELPINYRRVVEVWQDLYDDSPAKWQEIMSEMRGRYPDEVVTQNQVEQWFSRALKKLVERLKHLVE